MLYLKLLVINAVVKYYFPIRKICELFSGVLRMLENAQIRPHIL